MSGRTIQFLSHDRHAARDFRTGVSVHSHTLHSREGLGFLPHWAGRIPLLSWEFARQLRLYEARVGRPPDFAAAFWTSPVSSLAAFEIERRALEDDLGLQGIVSISDHDNIDAGRELQALTRQIPISVEWTVPMAGTFLHLGVHNLPVNAALDLMAMLSTYTRHPETTGLQDLLGRLDAEPGLLIVLNHPLWDQAGIGMDRHVAVVRRFLETMRERIHALELNGLRPWTENQLVVNFARHLDRPLISGGDRHGREPNAVVNLTNATTFAEFADEVRSGGSHVLFLPQYDEPLCLRIFEALCDVFQHCPNVAPRDQWTDRVFYTRSDGTCAPLSSVWLDGGPVAVRGFVRIVELFGNDVTQRALRRTTSWRNRRRSPVRQLEVSQQDPTPLSLPLPPL